MRAEKKIIKNFFSQVYGVDPPNRLYFYILLLKALYSVYLCRKKIKSCSSTSILVVEPYFVYLRRIPNIIISLLDHCIIAWLV